MISKKRKSEKTKSIYNISLNKLVAVKKKYIKDITDEDINFLIDKFNGKKKSEETIRTYLRHIKIFFQDCKNKNFIESNPVKNFKVKSNHVLKIISDDQLAAIFDFFKKRNKKHYYFVRFLNATGLRISEAVSLTWNDIDFTKKTIVIKNSKGKRLEEIPLTKESEELFMNMEYTSEKIFN